jgi:hypothetical protein
MTDQQINEAITTECGWIYYDGWHDVKGCEGLPDYCNDLNAMHEAEKFLEGGRNWNKYTEILGKLRHYKPNIHDLRSFANIIVSASAKQRAEAFLKTIGKWEN